jgi:hypothetical protein
VCSGGPPHSSETPNIDASRHVISGVNSYLLVLACSVVCFGFHSSAAGGKKLIEFGWDEPDTAFMRRHIAEMEQMPFDGCVFHITYTKPGAATGSFLSEAWGRRAFAETELKSAAEDLKATSFHRFTHNFLRFDVTPGDVDWFDDFSAILHNAALAARIAREGGCKGILFDIEQYQAPLFEYHRCRDAATNPWDAYAAQARRRGREVQQAFQGEFPGVVVFLTYGYSLPWAELHPRNKSLAEVKYGLLVPFLDGMVEASQRPKSIVEGGEFAYSYTNTSSFAQAYKRVKQDLLPLVSDPEKYHEVFSFGFGLWVDDDWRKKGWNDTDPQKNYFTPTRLEASLREALRVSDEYVWLYTEEPRWWSDSGKPVKLPEAYIDAVRRARE